MDEMNSKLFFCYFSLVLSLSRKLGKMVIHEKLFIDFIHNGVMDTNSVNNLIAAILKAIIILLIGT